MTKTNIIQVLEEQPPYQIMLDPSLSEDMVLFRMCHHTLRNSNGKSLIYASDTVTIS